MLATGRYRKTDKEFKLQAEVDLGDGGPLLVVDVDFLQARQEKTEKGRTNLACSRTFVRSTPTAAPQEFATRSV